jgi:SAM-dependent methyltransferase
VTLLTQYRSKQVTLWRDRDKRRLIAISAPFLFYNTLVPHSYGYFKQEIKEHFLQNVAALCRILDVGAGSGTYASLLAPEYKLDAIEIFPDYIARFNLNSLYQHIHIGNIETFDFSAYEYLIFGDVLEHISIESAQRILSQIQESGKRCLVAVPYMFEQGESEGNIFEAHLQPDLTHEVFLERYPQMQCIHRNDFYGYYCNYEFYPIQWKQKVIEALKTAEPTILIQEDYWTGTDCLKNSVPWMVPGAVYKLDAVLSNKDRVLEFGSGGSTLFFAKRCHDIFSAETHLDWHNAVQMCLQKAHLSNVCHCRLSSQYNLENVFNWLLVDSITVLVVDTMHGFDRSSLLNLGIQMCRNLRIIVLDNYSSTELFPSHFDWTDSQFCTLLGSNWRSFAYDDNFWHGSGTKILIKE